MSHCRHHVASARRHVALLATLLVAISVLAAVSAGAASARVAASARGASAASTEAGTCVVNSLPSFIDQGEEATEATVGDVVEVECDPTRYGTGSKIKISAAQLYAACEGHLTWYVANPFTVVPEAIGVSVALDADGNATVALRAGPGCQASESLITAHMEESPFESFATSFTVLPPVTTRAGVFAEPSVQVENGLSSSVATIVQAEFAGGSEKTVRIASEELYHRCVDPPHLRWVLMDGEVIGGAEGAPEALGVPLDNDGNAFVIAIGDGSCAEGPSMIEADLESKPFTTFLTSFEILPPQPTGTALFKIEKLQHIAGTPGGFTTSPLKASLGQTVEYEIAIQNTGRVAERFSAFTDPHCDAGTIAGGPGETPVQPGSSTTYTCDHVLTAVGVYTNQATVTGTTVGARPVEETSNEVEVEVPPGPAFTIVKRQRIGAGSAFTTERLTGSEGQTVEYQIEVKNTGNVALTFSGFSDPHCDPGTIAGGPGDTPVAPGFSTTYTCSRVLKGAGTYVNEATVTGTPSGRAPITHTSDPVEVVVPEGAPPTSPTVKPGGEGGVLPLRCEEHLPRLPGISGQRTGPFALRVVATDIKQITFAVDRRTVATLTQSHARDGRFTVVIDPRRFSYGRHEVKVTAQMAQAACRPAARTSAFVRSKPSPARFTG